MRLVQKYGGTSVATIEKILDIAEYLINLKEEKNELVVVVSAMGKTTDELIRKAHSITDKPDRREMDMLLSTGEQQTIALLTMALHTKGQKAISLTGHQAGIETIGTHTKSKIKNIEKSKIECYLAENKIVIIAGFQGVNEYGDVTTLGRGGSDTSAVALAAALKCPCEIYTDVEGICTVDPREYEAAKKLERISYDEMIRLAGLGAGVMEPRAVELGKKFGVPIYVGKSLSHEKGTHITERDAEMEEKVITGLSINEDTLMVNFQHIENNPVQIAEIFSTIGRYDVNIDMISQSKAGLGLVDVSFTCSDSDEDLLDKAIAEIKLRHSAMAVEKSRDIVRVSVVGVGMANHSGVAGRLFTLFAEKKIKFYQVTTSEISLSFTIDAANKKDAVYVIAKEFGL